uniref:protein-glutamine gamma-glutamyltransferase n=1 Tax=Hadrurus spadix TaxID=141984 RepID=A0A1W7RB00_9SCOR
MGNCVSSFRAQFRPNQSSGTSPSIIPLTPSKPVKPANDDASTEVPKPTSDEKPPQDGEAIEETVLTVESVDLCISENATSHHTDEFDLVQKEAPKLVIRRGSPFKITIRFNREYNDTKDAVCLVFMVKDAKTPSYSQGTLIVSPVLSESNCILPKDAWRTLLLSKDDKTIIVEVVPTATAIIGVWTLDVDTKLKTENEETAKTSRHTVKDPFYLLFNPWCPEDTVYMSDPEARKEYVLNDSGLIWRGSHNRLRPCIWNFAQFEENVLECCCYLLSNIGKLNVVGRADPIRVVRHLSAVVNSPDDAGVLVGNWTGSYSGGTNPTFWGGSMSILQQYYKTKKPVKFGQCWVFSGICTTVCRALGIPARSVTNFASAHDTHNSLTIDQFYNDEGDPIERLNVDSVWNFHVWNEVWMERPDLEPGGYGGWQAVDATPQEESDGAYRCGPASLAAIKRGEIMKAYDTSFLFAEVNADKVYWRYRGATQPLKLIQKSSDAIGQHISTKAMGQFEREDLTSEYKYSERSKEEREVMLRALRQCRNSFSRYYLNEELEDIEFDFTLLDDIVVGSPFMVKLKANNKSTEKEYNIQVVLRVDTVLYTGRLKNLVKKDKFDIKIGPGVEEEMTMKVSYEDYTKLLADQCAFNIAAMAKVVETGHDYFAQDDFRVRMPDVKIETEGELVQGQEFTVNAYFNNPLPKPLRKSVFILEGPGLGQPLKLPIKGNILAGQEARVVCKMTPKSFGEKSIVAKFQSRDLDDVDGYKQIQVKPKTETEKQADGNSN